MKHPLLAYLCNFLLVPYISSDSGLCRSRLGAYKRCAVMVTLGVLFIRMVQPRQEQSGGVLTLLPNSCSLIQQTSPPQSTFVLASPECFVFVSSKVPGYGIATIRRTLAVEIKETVWRQQALLWRDQWRAWTRIPIRFVHLHLRFPMMPVTVRFLIY